MKDRVMHFEILVEDESGKVTLDQLIPQIIGSEHTFKIHFYKGIGRIPKGLKPSSDPQKRILLDQLPRLIGGYGKTFANSGYPAVLIIVCDLDERCQKDFRQELLELLDKCNPKPQTYFCFAVEELEAWYLGDFPAVRKAYPHVKEGVLNLYSPDSICGTWEKLADAIVPDGAKSLSKLGWQAIGREKSAWAAKITQHMDVTKNLSPSFCYFRNKLQSLAKKQI